MRSELAAVSAELSSTRQPKIWGLGLGDMTPMMGLYRDTGQEAGYYYSGFRGVGFYAALRNPATG